MTARTQAKLFKTLKARNPDSNIQQTIRAMIAVRFRLLPNEDEQIWMYRQDDKYLYTFVLNLLRVEAGFDNLDPSTKSKIEDVVREELLKSGLGKEALFGEPAPPLTPARQKDAQMSGWVTKTVVSPRIFQQLTGGTSA
jgi:hypothetical protein